jgi:TatD DNase family protein
MPVEVKKEKFVPGKAVKGRNEPYATSQVACVLASLHGVSLEEVADQTRRNTLALFGSAGMKDEPGRTGE